MLWKSNDFSSRYFQKHSALFALLSHLGILFLGGATLPARNVATAGARDEQIMLLPHLRSSDHLMRFHPHTVNKILGRQLFRPGDDACMESPFSYYPDVTSPDFFLYYEYAFKDFTSYFDIDDSGLGVFTDLLELFKAPCEFAGGTLYNITGTQACYDENYTMTDFDFPYCAPKGCVIDKELVESSEEFDYCIERKDVNFHVSVVKPSIMTKACNQELYSFSAEAPGPGKLYDVLADADSDEFFAGEVEGTLIYDFSPLLENATKVCEAEGGRLYKYSDRIVYFDGTSFQYLNGPICIGSSCDVEKYFDEVFEPALMFFFDGNRKDQQFDEDGNYAGNGTYPLEQTYEFISYEVSTIAPTKAPTISYTIAPTKAKNSWKSIKKSKGVKSITTKSRKSAKKSKMSWSYNF